jgi:opacity protein-like surface antigen
VEAAEKEVIMRSKPEHSRRRGRVALGVFLSLAVLTLGARAAGAGEIVPSLGVTKTVNGDVDAKMYGGVAFRADLLPMVRTEIGAAYRSESRYGDRLKLRQWPITASLYLAPVRGLYAGGGVGWYHTTYDYASSVPVQDETHQQFGVHLGGGLQVPLGERVGVDLNGRYVMLRDQQSHLVPEKFDPDFWQTSVGLAFRL